jgi:hypothetical protein
MLVGRLRVLLRTRGMFFSFRMVALAMVFGGRPMRLRSVFVMFGSLIMFVSSHDKPRWLLAPSCAQVRGVLIVPAN